MGCGGPCSVGHLASFCILCGGVQVPKRFNRRCVALICTLPDLICFGVTTPGSILTHVPDALTSSTLIRVYCPTCDLRGGVEAKMAPRLSLPPPFFVSGPSSSRVPFTGALLGLLTRHCLDEGGSRAPQSILVFSFAFCPQMKAKAAKTTCLAPYTARKAIPYSCRHSRRLC